MRRQPTHDFGVNLLLTPAGVVAGHDIFRQVAPRASPLSCYVFVLISVIVCYSSSFISSPFFNAADVEDCPAGAAGPNLGVSRHFVGADCTFIDAVGNVFVDSGGDAWGR